MSWLWQPSLAQGQAGQAASGAWVEPGRSLTLSAVLLLFVFRGLIFFFFLFEPRMPQLSQLLPHYQGDQAISITAQPQPGSGEGLKCMHVA